MEAADQGFWDLNLSTNEIFFSDRCNKMLGYDDQSALPTVSGPDTATRIHDEDRPGLFERIEACRRSETPNLEHEMRLRHRDGLGIAVRERDRGPARVTRVKTHARTLYAVTAR